MFRSQKVQYNSPNMMYILKKFPGVIRPGTMLLICSTQLAAVFAACAHLPDLSLAVTDRGRPIRLLEFALLSPTEPIRGRYQSGCRWHVSAAPQRRPLPMRGPAPVWCLDWRRCPPLRREKDAHRLLFFPTLLNLMIRRYVPRWNSLSDYCL